MWFVVLKQLVMVKEENYEVYMKLEENQKIIYRKRDEKTKKRIGRMKARIVCFRKNEQEVIF